MDNKDRNDRDNKTRTDRFNNRNEDQKRAPGFSHKRPFQKDNKERGQESEKPRKLGATDFRDKKVWKKPDEGNKPWENDTEDLKDFEKEVYQDKGRAAKFKEENKKKFTKGLDDESFEDDVPFNVKPVKKSSKSNIRPDRFFDDEDLDEGIGGYEKIKKTKK